VRAPGPGDGERAARLAFGDGPKLRAGAEAFARGALHDELAQRPWLKILARAKALGRRGAGGRRGAPAEELDYLPARERKRAEREGGEAAKRAARRARAGALDQALQLVGLWFATWPRWPTARPRSSTPSTASTRCSADAEGRGPHALRGAVEHVDEARALLILNPSEELLLEALAYRLARGCGAR
jgi:DNA polymerase-3 subunit delta'